MKDRSDWMSGRYGLMVHYLPGGRCCGYGRDGSWTNDPYRQVRQFDVEKLMEVVDAFRASWLVFPFGQNSGWYASPNEAISRRIGKSGSSMWKS